MQRNSRSSSMANRTSHHGLRAASLGRRLRAAWSILLATAVTGMFGCSDRTEHAEGGSFTLSGSRVQVTEPAVEFDLDTLRESGTLRVLLQNSASSYYVMRGEEWGFEYELAREVARTLGLQLRVVLPDSMAGPLDLLNLGQVDLVAMAMRPEEAPEANVSYTAPYHTVQQTLVVNAAHADSVREPSDLAGKMVAVRHFSSAERALFALREQGHAVGIVMHPPDMSIEEILDLVADGTYPAAVADDSDVEATVRFRNELVEAFTLDDPRPVHWAVRSNAPLLLAAVDSVLAGLLRIREDGSRAGSEFYNVVHSRYFADESQLKRHGERSFHFARSGRLSPYDDLFRAAAQEVDLDWRLLAAVAFQESRFDPMAESAAGAIGLMQVLPRTAGISADSLRVPEINIAFGARHLRSLYDAYRFVSERERLRFALAAYNCGQGHLDDARILSVLRNRNPNAWDGSVRDSLLLLRRPDYYQQVRYGYVRGHETVAYVRDVLTRYELLQQLSQPRRAPSDRVIVALTAETAN